MQQIRKITKYYYTPLIFLVILFIFSQIQVYKDLEKDLLTENSYYNHFFSSSIQSHLHKIELILDTMGHRLLDQKYHHQDQSIQSVSRGMLQRNPLLLGFVIFDKEGRPISYSGADYSLLPNLKDHPETRESFQETLENKTMIVGRAYYSNLFHQWIIPFRKTLLNSTGDIEGVISTAIGVDSAEQVWNKKNLNDQIHSVIVKDKGRWPIYCTPLPKELQKHVLGNPIEKKAFASHLAQVAQKAAAPNGTILRQIKESYQYKSVHPRTGQKSVFTVEFSKRYDLWVLTYMPLSAIKDIFWENFLRKSPFVFSIFGLFLFVFHKIYKKEEEASRALQFQARHDPLTRLLNRSVFTTVFPKWINETPDGFYLLHLDMDNFKYINDTFGHTLGDQVLVEIGSRLEKLKPVSADIIRHGGDEFTIITKVSEKFPIDLFCEHVIKVLSSPYSINNMNAYIGCSIGISQFPKDGENRELLMIAADLALQDAKITKNSYSFFNEDMQQKLVRKTMLANSLRHAISNGELHMVFQPKVYQSGKTYGVEALLRWQSPQHGTVSPGEFICIAESAGLMPALGNFVIKKSCNDFAQILQQSSPHAQDITLSINISVQQLFEKDFQDILLGALSINNINKSQVILEITETLFIEELDYTLPLLEEIREHGIRISLDDFGTGYSSLSMLRNLPIDELKIDKSFINNIATELQDTEMVKSIISMGQIMGMSIVAEGVENKEQIVLLAHYNCEIFQGYYFSRPLETDDLIQYLQAEAERYQLSSQT